MPSDRTSPPRTPHRRISWQPAPLRALPLALALAAALVTFTGCAAPGEPSPRRPVVPQAVKDLAAVQQGDNVVLNFTLPRESSEEEKPMPGPFTVEIYRGTPSVAPGVSAAPNQATPRQAPQDQPQGFRLVDTIPASMVNTFVTGGRVEFHDPLVRAELEANPGRPLAYLVRTRISAKRASADSNTVIVRVYPAPEAARDLRATLTEQAIVLDWTPAAGASPAYRVYRGEVAPPAGPSEPAAKPKVLTPMTLLAEISAAEYRDTDFEFGHTYVYDVRSVAHFGADSVESDKADPGATVEAKDTFPPGVPQDLVAVVTLATPEAPAYVELTWGINTEADLAGYIVYRSEQPDTLGEKLTGELLPSPTFRDIAVASGRRYIYRVGAVDRVGNQSAPSSAATAEIP